MIINGTGLDDEFHGGSENDEMRGFDGDDTLGGGGGNDWIHGGNGNDTLAGGDGNDWIIGGDGADWLFGDDGNDILSGGHGVDRLYGGSGIDTADYGGSGSGVVASLDTGHGYSGTAQGDSYFSLENLFGSLFGDVLYGDNLDNRLDGYFGNDFLIGYAGNDTLVGGPGTDQMYGGLGWDSYYVDNAGDVVSENPALFGGAGGVDTVYASVSFSLGDNVEHLTLTGIAGIAATGNALANRLTGNAGANVMEGHAGSDVLIGGNGSDRIVGAAGNDQHTGGNGNDLFVFNTAINAGDTIFDFSAPNDTIQLENALFAALPVLGVLNADAFHVGVAAADAEDRIIYNAATGALSYDANGVGGAAAIQFAVLDNLAAVTAADFVVI
jgi:serralysin